MTKRVVNDWDQGRILRVLLADESPTGHQTLREELQRAEGVEVVADASTSQHAIELFFDLKPDIVIVSACLAAQDGFEVLRCIKRAFAHCPVILTIRQPDSFVTEAARLLGATAVCCLAERPSQLLGILKGLDFRNPD